MNAAAPASFDQILRTNEAPVWLHVGALFDGTCNSVVRNAHFVYNRRQILHAGASLPAREMVRDGQSEPDLDLPEHTLLPGLVEAHAHLFLEGGEEDPANRALHLTHSDETLLARAQTRLARMLCLGITAIRDAGDKNGVGLALQRRYHSPLRGAMPYIDSPGAAIHHQGRYGAFMGRSIEEHGSYEATIAARVAAGAHRVKLLATGLINFEKGAVTAKPQMPADELTCAVTIARNHARQTFAHCSGHDGVANCLAARVDSIEHGFFVDHDQLARMRDLDIAWVPTFAPVQFQLERADTLGWNDSVRGNLQRILDGHAASLVHGAEIGVRIVAGSDAGSHGVPHGHGFLWELELMERAGLDAGQVLRSATGAGAERLGFAENFGVLRAGARPRFLLTTAPVLASVRHLRTPLAVVFDGAVHTGGDDPSRAGL
jgi:imidazolonepropionase-like amidohydrolase